MDLLSLWGQNQVYPKRCVPFHLEALKGLGCSCASTDLVIGQRWLRCNQTTLIIGHLSKSSKLNHLIFYALGIPKKGTCTCAPPHPLKMISSTNKRLDKLQKKHLVKDQSEKVGDTRPNQSVECIRSWRHVAANKIATKDLLLQYLRHTSVPMRSTWEITPFFLSSKSMIKLSLQKVTKTGAHKVYA